MHKSRKKRVKSSVFVSPWQFNESTLMSTFSSMAQFHQSNRVHGRKGANLFLQHFPGIYLHNFRCNSCLILHFVVLWCISTKNCAENDGKIEFRKKTYFFRNLIFRSSCCCCTYIPFFAGHFEDLLSAVRVYVWFLLSRMWHADHSGYFNRSVLLENRRFSSLWQHLFEHYCQL